MSKIKRLKVVCVNEQQKNKWDEIYHWDKSIHGSNSCKEERECRRWTFKGMEAIIKEPSRKVGGFGGFHVGDIVDVKKTRNPMVYDVKYIAKESVW